MRVQVLLFLAVASALALAACDEIVGINPHELVLEGGVDGAGLGNGDGIDAGPVDNDL